MYYCTRAMPRINRVGRISRIAKQVRARHKLPLTKKRTKSLSALPAARSPRVSSPCVKQPPAISSPFSPLFSVCCIFSPFRESNRVVDCSAAKGKRTRRWRWGALVFVASASRKIPTTGNRPSCPATERRRPLDAYRRARGCPPLYCSRPCRLFSRRALPHRSSSTKSRRKRRAVAGTRTEKGRARTKPNEYDGRAQGARRRDSRGKGIVKW